MNILGTRLLVANAPTIEEAKRILFRAIRYGARKQIFIYATKNLIMDFDDMLLVTQRHRDTKDQYINFAQNKVDDVIAATTVEELLVIFDLISPYL